MTQPPAKRGAATRRRRADAERSAEAILDAALACVVTSSEVNMAAIARAAGLSRVTLYAHFATREALLEAVVQRAVGQLTDGVREAAIDEGPPAQALSRLLLSSWGLLDRYRNLYAVASTALTPARLRAQHEAVLGPVERLLVRGQSTGDFRADLPLTWLVATIYSLAHLAAEEVNAGRLPADRAGEVLATTVLSLLSP